MAGEWLKFESTLPEKAETLAITAAMGWDDPDLTVGKLMRMFRWFDQQTIDGNAPNVTPALLDRIIGVTGFVSAVASVGWIVIDGTSLSLHNFDRHNGETAKSRALTAKRVAKHKANAQGNGNGNADSVSSALPKEEKKREEKREDSLSAAAEKKISRKSQVPSDFHPNGAGIQAAELAGLDVKAEVRKFIDFHEGKGSVMASWDAAWRTWIGKAVEFGRGKPQKLNGDAAWLAGTPFTDTFEAHNAGCFAHNVAKFRTGAPA